MPCPIESISVSTDKNFTAEVIPGARVVNSSLNSRREQGGWGGMVEECSVPPQAGVVGFGLFLSLALIVLYCG